MKLRKGSWRNLSGYAKQLDLHSVLMQWVTWNILSLKKEWISNLNWWEWFTLFAFLISNKEKWISKHLFYWHNRVNDKEFGSVCLTKDIWGIYLEYINAAYVRFGLLLSMNQNDYKCLSAVPCCYFTRSLPIMILHVSNDMFTLNLLANLFSPFSLRSQSGLDPSL